MKDLIAIDLRGNRAQGQRHSLNSPNRSETAFQHAAAIIRQIPRQRLRMDNEQLGFPWSEAEVRALDRRAARRGTA